MERDIKTFTESIGEEYFDEYVSDICVCLKNKNKEYNKLSERIENLLNKFSNVRTIWEDGECMPLSVEEVKALQKCIFLTADSNSLEQKEVFLRGMREEYYLLERKELLKK